MDNKNPQYSLFENYISLLQSKYISLQKNHIKKKFRFNNDEPYFLTASENTGLSGIFNLKNISRNTEGDPVDKKKSVLVTTIRLEYGHYRTALAAVSCANAMGIMPYWLDILSVPGITTELINYKCTGSPLQRKLKQLINAITDKIPITIPWKNPFGDALLILTETGKSNTGSLLKTLKEREICGLFGNLFSAMPHDMPCISAHAWCTAGAVSGGMTNVVTLVPENIPLISSLCEGALHAVSSPSVYYALRILKNRSSVNRMLKPLPDDVLTFTGNHIDHEIVFNIENDCKQRLNRSRKDEPRRFLLTVNRFNSKPALLKSIIDHCIPVIQQNKAAFFINFGDYFPAWNKLQKDTAKYGDIIQVHSSWKETKDFADKIRNGKLEGGIHIFLHDNIFHAVYSTNYLMRVSDFLITDPNELAFYPVPKILTGAAGIKQKLNAIRSAETGDGSLECRTTEEILQAIDITAESNDILELFCSCIIGNKSAGLYDGAYKAVSTATGIKFDRARTESRNSADGKTGKFPKQASAGKQKKTCK
ncbi:MAG: hypothetical protein JW982_06155 [Spirochaetes bacterium]|nr:hypothetical protein [Spirochaetota bacterium]